MDRNRKPVLRNKTGQADEQACDHNSKIERKKEPRNPRA